MPLVAFLLGLCALVLLNRNDVSMKWNVPVFWSGVVFFSILDFRREYWREKVFWLRFVVALLAHVFMMWIVFGVTYPRVRITMIMTIPLVITETFLLLKLFICKRRRVAQV